MQMIWSQKHTNSIKFACREDLTACVRSAKHELFCPSFAYLHLQLQRAAVFLTHRWRRWDWNCSRLWKWLISMPFCRHLQDKHPITRPSLTRHPAVVHPGISASSRRGCTRCCTPAFGSPPTTRVWKQPSWFMTRRSSGLWGPSCSKPASCLSGNISITTHTHTDNQSSTATLKNLNIE